MDPSTNHKLNYRELQAIAKKLRLPGNLKYHLLLEVVEARKQGNEAIVHRVLEEQKVERLKRKSEKLEGREAAYKHLQIPHEKRPLGRPRKHPLPESTQKAKVKHRSVTDSYIRSLLTMPSHSIDELIRQSSLQPQPAPPDLAHHHDPLTTIHHPNPHRDKQCIPDNNELMDRSHHDNYQPPSLMEGCSVKDYSQITDCIGKSVSFNMNNHQYMNSNSGSTRNYEGLSNINYLEGWNKPNDHWHSFQMRDILANNGSTVMPQYYPYSEAGYAGSGSGGTDYSLQYVQDVSSMLMNNSKPTVLPYHHSVYQSSHSYWRGIWDEPATPPTAPTAPPSHDHYWRHYPNPSMNSYQCSSNRGIFPDFPTGYSPNSDTMSATEQEVESMVSHPHEPLLPDFKSANQMPYPLIYSYVALGDGQGVCQLPPETDIPGEIFCEEAPCKNGSTQVASDMDQSASNATTDCCLSERACSLSNLVSAYCLSPSLIN